MAIGKRIRERLNELNWKQSDLLAKIPNMTPQALSNLIRRDSVRSEWDVHIADALGVSLLWLVYGQIGEYLTDSKVTELRAREPEPLPFPLDQVVEAARMLNREGQLIAVGRLQEMARQYPKAKSNLSS